MQKAKLLLIFISSLYSIVSSAQPVSQWRGTNRDGIYNESNLLNEWAENGPVLLWTNDSIGEGYGSLVVSDDTLFVNGRNGNLSYVFAINMKGEIIWKAPNGIEFSGTDFAANFPGSRSTPTIYKNLVYASSGTGRICCLDKSSGKELWAVDMIKDLGGRMDQHGYCESLMVDENNVYCLPGGKEINVAALNRNTGKIIWKSEAKGDSASYCSPMIISLPQRNVLVTFSGHHILGLDAKTGELLWSQRQDYHEFHQQCNTPIFHGGAVYYSAGEGNGTVKLDLSSDGSEIKEVWRNKNIKNLFGGFLIKNEKIYTTSQNQKLYGVDIYTGKAVDSLRVTKGALINADEKLYCYSENGNINLIDFQSGKMEIRSKFICDYGTKEHFAHPVINKGILYIRHGKSLLAYDVLKH